MKLYIVNWVETNLMSHDICIYLLLCSFFIECFKDLDKTEVLSMIIFTTVFVSKISSAIP